MTVLEDTIKYMINALSFYGRVKENRQSCMYLPEKARHNYVLDHLSK